MQEIADGSIDLIIGDLPYGSTDCDWDKKLDLVKFWEQINRIVSDKGCIALTASQPFTTDLINSNRSMFKYCWVWNKSKGGNIMSCKYQPYKTHEDIVIFSKGLAARNNGKKEMNYYPKMEVGDRVRVGKNYGESQIFASGKMQAGFAKTYDQKYPKSIINISNAKQAGKIHPTEKPVELFKYLIETYTLPGMKVLDPCCGSGACLEASYQLDRECIGIEISEEYCNLIRQRMDLLTSGAGTSR